MIANLSLTGFTAVLILGCSSAGGPATVTSSAPKARSGTVAPSSGAPSPGANAAPANAAPARRVVPPRRRAASKGRPWLGVYLRGDSRPGVVVRKVHPGSPAAKAGLKAGDRILTINNATLASVRALQREVASYSPGDKVALEVRRAAKSLTIVVQLERLLTYEQRVRKALVGKHAPQFTVARVGGTGAKTISSQSMKGKVWILEFWATWCGACRQVIPMLKRIYQHYGPYGLHIVSIAKDRPARVARFAKLLKLPYTVGVDPRGKVLSKYLVSPIPAFMLINKKGVVIDVAVGRTWVTSFRRILKTVHAMLTKSHKARYPGTPARPRPRPRPRPQPLPRP